MRFRVIAHAMAAIGDLFRKRPERSDMLADEKERRSGVMTIEQIQKLRCGGRIRPVVEREGECRSVSRGANGGAK